MVVNPASDNGRTARRWPQIARAAAARGLDLDVRPTEAAGHATELTRAALNEGAGLIVAVGGDGTVSEVANGFFDGGAAVRPDVELAIVPRGSGCDFVKTFGIPKQVERAAAVAAGGEVRTVDLGRVRFTGWDGRPAERIFCNVASAGLTGVAADRVNRSGKPLGATVAFAWGTIVTFVAYRNSRFRVRIDERDLDQVCNNVIVANCRFYASGMKIMPMADPGDGLLDVLVWGDVGKADLALTLHKLYRGTHIGHPKADISRARRITVEPEDPLPIEADGETPGVTPATFEVVPAALRLRVPASG
jgi:diacylglycerol kinase (ATP)